MGNSSCKILPRKLSRQKKPKTILVNSKVVIPNGFVVHQHPDHDHAPVLDDDGDVFMTPTSDYSDSDEGEKDENFPTFICDICVEEKGLNDSFNLKGCSHFYCSECTISYVNSKLDMNITLITCPVSGCVGKLEPEFCRAVLPKEVFDRWGVALCEAVIDSSLKFYCPYKDCSSLLINDSGQQIQLSLCPFCKREFCAKCDAPWHSEITCQKFQKLKKKGDDGMLRDLAQRKNWRRCPQCKYYVEKSEGCYYIKCRCGYAFCYRCGARSSTNSHVCPKCKH